MPIIKKHENFIDFVSANCGNVAGMFDCAMLNNSSITDDYTGGKNLQISELNFTKQKVVSVKPYAPAVETNILKKHQNNTDFVTQHFGTMDCIFELAMLNQMSITENPVPGSVFKTRSENLEVVTFFKVKQLDISSRELPMPIFWLPGGIGFMKIINPDLPQSNDFIAS